PEEGKQERSDKPNAEATPKRVAGSKEVKVDLGGEARVNAQGEEDDRRVKPSKEQASDRSRAEAGAVLSEFKMKVDQKRGQCTQADRNHSPRKGSKGFGRMGVIDLRI